MIRMNRSTSIGSVILLVVATALPATAGIVPPGYVDSTFHASGGRTQSAITVDASGNVYVTDRATVGRLRKITPDGTLSTLTSDFTAGVGFFPWVATDIHAAGDSIYSVMSNGDLIQIDSTTGIASLLTTLPATSIEAGLDLESGTAYTTTGSSPAGEVRATDLGTLVTTPFATLPTAQDVSVEISNGRIFASERGGANRIWEVTGGVTSLVASGVSGPQGRFAVDAMGEFLYTKQLNTILQVDIATGVSSVFASGLSSFPYGDLAFGRSSSGSGLSLYYTENDSRVGEISGFRDPAVPEPASLAIFGIGTLGIVAGGLRRRKRVQSA